MVRKSLDIPGKGRIAQKVIRLKSQLQSSIALLSVWKTLWTTPSKSRD